MFIPFSGVCVYQHTVAGRVVYVGKGDAERFAHRKGRSDLWKRLVSQAGGFEVSILRWFATDAEARAFEKRAIARLQPECNVYGLPGRKRPASEAHRRHLSESGKGRVFTEEHKRKIGEANRRRARVNG